MPSAGLDLMHWRTRLRKVLVVIALVNAQESLLEGLYPFDVKIVMRYL